MKTDRNILIAFILNLAFSIFEFIGGALTGSVAIASDALHDLGDAASIGISYFMERKSKKGADDKYTFGYGRYSVLGGLLTSTVLLIGSVMVITNAITRLRHPVEVNHTGMLIFAIIGIMVNFIAAKVTKDGNSVNQKAVNLHMLEDMMGWIAVLVGAVIMHFTSWTWIDPVLSILVALTILYSSIMNMFEITSILTEKVPEEIDINTLKKQFVNLEDVQSVQDIKVWSINSKEMYAVIHIRTANPQIKVEVRKILAEHNIVQSTIECSESNEIISVFSAAHPKNCGCDHHHHHFPKIPPKK
ncbi:MAG: cation transporter [Bacteroidaceae bacterium]|nr:cation transporter [Bacteroidaceae bacterium]